MCDESFEVFTSTRVVTLIECSSSGVDDIAEKIQLNLLIKYDKEKKEGKKMSVNRLRVYVKFFLIFSFLFLSLDL